MADRNIVTQVGIEDLKFALAEIAENLDSHINASLSKAHGINLITGYVDAYGNDLTTYRDSNGDLVASYFIRFTIDGVVYYAPASFTTLDGQPATNGSVDTSPDTDTSPESGSSWVTDYTSDQVAQAESINNDVLVEHTRRPHWDAHGGLTVLTQDSFSNLGHKVGTHIIQMRVGGTVYNIPCSTRLGGPVQLPRGVSILASYYDKYDHPRDVNLSVPTTVTGGTLPFTYQWQIFSNAGWVDITPNPVTQSVSDGSKSVNIRWTSYDSGTMVVVESNPGNGATHSFIFRVIVTSAAGSTTSNNFQYTVTNDTDETWLCGVAHEFGFLTDDEYRTDGAWSRENIGIITYSGYTWWAEPLAGWFRKHPFGFYLAAPFVLAWTKEVCFRSGSKRRGSLMGKVIMLIGRPICNFLGVFRALVAQPTCENSCFITSAVVHGMGKPDDCYELNALRGFRNLYVIPKHPEAWAEYKEIAPKIVAAINAQEGSEHVWGYLYRNYIVQALAMIEEHCFDEAYAIYEKMVNELKNRWLR